MINGIKTYHLPNSCIEVEISYRIIQGIGLIFDCATIEDNELDCDMLGLHIDVTKPSDLIRQTKYISLKEWFLSKLKHDLNYVDEECESEKSDYDEHNLNHKGGFL